MKRLRILQLGPYPPPRGGVQTNMFAIQDEVIRRGHISEILAITRSEEIGSEPNVYHPRGPLDFIRHLFRIPHDILHLHLGGNLSFRVRLMAFFCTLFSSGRKVLTFHSGGFARSKEGQSASRRSLTGYIFRRFDHIIVVNAEMKRLFERYGVNAGKIDLILPYALKRPDPNIPIPDKFLAFFKTHEHVLITVGLLESDYDLPLQIGVLEEIIRKEPGAGLVIIGSGSLRQELETLIDSTGYSEHIFLAGDIDREVVLRLIEKADVLLRTTVFDGDAISIREALFLGTPVVATDNGMRPEHVKLIPVGGAAELEEAILQSLAEPKPAVTDDADGRENIKAVVDLYERLAVGV